MHLQSNKTLMGRRQETLGSHYQVTGKPEKLARKLPGSVQLKSVLIERYQELEEGEIEH